MNTISSLNLGSCYSTTSVLTADHNITFTELSDLETLSTELSSGLSSSVVICRPDTALSLDVTPSREQELKIYKLPLSAWEDLVVMSADALSVGELSNAVFIPEADYIEGYGRQLCNIVMDPNAGTDSLSVPDVAATKAYVDAKFDDAKEACNTVNSFINKMYAKIGHLSNLDRDTMSCDNTFAVVEALISVITELHN